MKNKLLYILFACAFAYASCKKESTENIGDRPVIVAYLIPGQAVSVKVYQQKAFDDTSSYGALLGGLSPELSDGTQTIQLSETATGTYTYADTTYLQTGKTYSLQFSYNNSVVSATTQIPAKPTGYAVSKTEIVMPNYVSNPGNPGDADSVAVTFRWDNPDSLYHMLVFKNMEDSPFSVLGRRFNAQVNFSINVKQSAGYDAYYRTFNYKGTYHAMLFTVNKEYSDVLSSNANTSSQQLTNPPGNITNGYGIFTGMQADTIAIHISQL